jgi:hypothetical protein
VCVLKGGWVVCRPAEGAATYIVVVHTATEEYYLARSRRFHFCLQGNLGKDLRLMKAGRFRLSSQPALVRVTSISLIPILEQVLNSGQRRRTISCGFTSGRSIREGPKVQ